MKKYSLVSSLDGMSKVKVSFDNRADALWFGQVCEWYWQGASLRNMGAALPTFVTDVLDFVGAMISKARIHYIDSTGHESDMTDEYRNPDFADAAYDLLEAFCDMDGITFVDDSKGSEFALSKMLHNMFEEAE